MAVSKSYMILRKAFSTVAPRALRPISSPRVISAAVNKMEMISYNSHHFCTDASKNLLHQKIVTALQTERKTPKIVSLEKAMPPIPADFPFTIKECNGFWMNLTRELDGERIDVNVSCPDSLRYSRCFNEDSLKEPDVYLIVSVSEESGRGLTFEVYLSSDDIRVSSLWVDEPAPDSDETRCFGYYALKKDGSVFQSGLREFLEMRGVETKHFEFLCSYMKERNKRCPVVMLEKLENYFN